MPEWLNLAGALGWAVAAAAVIWWGSIEIVVGFLFVSAVAGVCIGAALLVVS